MQVAVATWLSLDLGRELILPPLWCGLENGWTHHNGRAEAAEQYQLPSHCSAEKILMLAQYALPLSQHKGAGKASQRCSSLKQCCRLPCQAQDAKFHTVYDINFEARP